jgi:DNA-binding NtrC family response regulator
MSEAVQTAQAGQATGEAASKQTASPDPSQGSSQSSAQNSQVTKTQPIDSRLPWTGASSASRELLELARKVAETSTTLLITGESGAGKDRLARWIHEESSRREAPFLKIDCASLTPELVESELFGHEKGAFTGAVAQKPGRLELAEDGTIVLDEVAALPAGIQAKLLRVLEERRFERLGGTQTLKMDARLMALTNANLPRAVEKGMFREDLYFRLNVLTIVVPPLRERREDILPLASYFLEQLGLIHGRTGLRLSAETRDLLEAYAWPGNTRELRNALERALVVSKMDSKEDELGVESFPGIAQSGALAGGRGRAALVGLRSIEELEREAISATLEATHYKISQAAAILGMSRKTLLEKRKKYGFMDKK